MTVIFGWRRLRLKSFTFQELNLPELDKFPNATFQVAQSYFHIFFIPVFSLGKRYDLVMNKELYHVPPGVMNAVDKEQIKVRGKWYAWSLPILAILTVLIVMISSAVKKQQQDNEFPDFEEDLRELEELTSHNQVSADQICFWKQA